MENIYTPNSKRELERLDYRMIWEDEIKKYLLHLNKIKDEDYCLSKREWRNSLGKKHEKYGLTPKDIKAYISEYKRLVWSGINAFLRKKNDIPDNISTVNYFKGRIRKEK